MLDVSEILNARILIVDDQKANVLLLEQMLHSAGYRRVTSTSDPRSVRELHVSHHFDLILLDLQMPEMDGFEVLEQLKTIEGEDYLPVLVITAQPAHKLRALQAGARDFVSKPFDLIEVQTRIHNMLEVRLLYQRLNDHNKILEQAVFDRTAELRASEARFMSFTALSSDWYWEQDALGHFTKVSGPVYEMLGIDVNDRTGEPDTIYEGSWNDAEREMLQMNIAERKPFLDFGYSRIKPDGTTQYLQVSGEPMFDSASRFIGYRGIGMELTDRRRPDLEQMRFRQAMGEIPQSVLMLECSSLRIIDANEKMICLLGYTRLDLLALAPEQLGLGASTALAQKLDALQAGVPIVAEETVLRHKTKGDVACSITWSILVVLDTCIAVAQIESLQASSSLNNDKSRNGKNRPLPESEALS